MAAKEMYDYLSTVAPDVDVTLSVDPWRVVVEEGEKRQEVIFGADGSEEVVSQSDDSVYYVNLQWQFLSGSDAGTIFDLYHDSAKANGIKNSIKWVHPSDGHTYVVKFRGKLTRTWVPGLLHQVDQIRLRVIGRIADA